MAVEDKYVNADIVAGRLSDANRRGVVGYMLETFETAAADSDGSIYRLWRVPSSLVVLKAELYTDGVTSGTDFELGCYLAGAGGAAVDIDSLMGTQDISSASSVLAPDGAFTAVAIENIAKPLWSLQSGVTVDPFVDYDIALTGNTVGSGAVTVTVLLLCAL